MDPSTAEPTLEDVEHAWPRWHTWRGICGLVYASRGMTSPAAVVRGEDPLDLLDQIFAWEGRQTPGGTYRHLSGP